MRPSIAAHLFLVVVFYQVTVSQFDGMRISDQSNQIIMRKSNVFNYENATETKHTLNADGTLHYSTIVADKRGFALEAIYLDAEEGTGWISPAEEQTTSYLQAILKTEKYEPFERKKLSQN